MYANIDGVGDSAGSLLLLMAVPHNEKTGEEENSGPPTVSHYRVNAQSIHLLCTNSGMEETTTETTIRHTNSTE